jgi:hypothetical protein
VGFGRTIASRGFNTLQQCIAELEGSVVTAVGKHATCPAKNARHHLHGMIEWVSYKALRAGSNICLVSVLCTKLVIEIPRLLLPEIERHATSTTVMTHLCEF